MRRTTLIIVICAIAIGGFVLGRLTGGDQAALGVGAVKRVFAPPPAPPSDAILSSGGVIVVDDTAPLIVEVPGDNAVIGASFEVAGRAGADYSSVVISVRDGVDNVIANDTAPLELNGAFGRFSRVVNLLALPSGDGKVEIVPVLRDGTRGTAVLRPIRFAEADTVMVKIFFGLEADGGVDCQQVHAVERSISSKGQIYRQAIDELLKGPTAAEKSAGYFSSLPAGVVLKGSPIADADGRVVADFNAALGRGIGGACRVTAIRAQIISTLKQFPEVREAVISIGGRTEDILQP